MYKDMAEISNGVVQGIFRYLKEMPESENLIDVGDYQVRAGDTVIDGEFYRNGEKLKTEKEELIKDYQDSVIALNSLIEETFQNDMTIFEE